MKPTFWTALFTVALGLSVLAIEVRAEDGPVPGAAPAATEDELPAEMKRLKATVAGMVKAVGDARLTEADVKSIVKRAKSFHALGKKEGEKEDGIKTVLDTHYEKTGTYDFELLYAMPELKAWAAANEVDARQWVRRFLRVTSLGIRKDLQRSSAEMLETLPAQLAQIEALRGQMDEASFANAKQAIERALGMARTMDAAAKVIPAATEEESRLLSVYEKELEGALHDGDDDDTSEDGDDDDSEDDDSEDDDDASEGS